MTYHMFDERELLPLPRSCAQCGIGDGVTYKSGPHMRLDCLTGHYVKFLGQPELTDLRKQQTESN